jgi:hypothetical protein
MARDSSGCVCYSCEATQREAPITVMDDDVAMPDVSLSGAGFAAASSHPLVRTMTRPIRYVGVPRPTKAGSDKARRFVLFSFTVLLGLLSLYHLFLRKMI